MIERIIIAGAGGQGVMLLGKVLAAAADKESKFVTWLPAYGAEVRGGTAYCMVTISDGPINSPYIDRADTLIVMNAPSMRKFKNRITPAGLLILNASMVKQKKTGASFLQYPFTDIANKMGNVRTANMVALGCYIGAKKIIGEKSVMKVIAEIAPPDKKDLIEVNQKAVLKGIGITVK